MPSLSRVRWARFVAVAGLLLAPVLSSAVTPQWVKDVATQTVPAYEPDTNAIVLIDSANITVTAPGEYTEHNRRAVRILRNEGREEAQLAVYLQGRDKLKFIHCWSIDSKGREFELKDREFEQRGFAEYLYDDIHWQTGTCPAGEPGSTIAFEYEVQHHWWLNEWERDFQEDIPVRESRVTLKVPAGWEYKALWANGQPVDPSKTSEGEWQWTLHDLAAIDHEPMRPSIRALSMRMKLVYFSPEQNFNSTSSWNALGRWYTQLTADRRVPSPALVEKAHQLTQGKTDFDGKVRALSSFLQTDVRYVAIEIGIGGYQPHPAADVFKARYGDCKDKATLLSTMLHEVGVEADYLVINTNRGIAVPELPSSGSFNHVILAIELPADVKEGTYRAVVTSKAGKRYLLFDPTDTFTPLGELRGDLQSTNALLVADGGGELISTPLLAPATNLLSRIGHFTIGNDGVLSGEVIEDRTGDHAASERAALKYSNEQQRTRHLEGRLNRSLKGFTLQSADIRQLDQTDEKLSIDYKFSDPGYGQIRGPLMLVRPRVLGEKSMALERKPRHFPFQFERATRETDVYEFNLPEGYVVDDIPEAVKVDMGFASYESKFEVKEKVLRYSREFVRRDVLVQADRTADLRKLEGIIGADENAAVVLKRIQ